MSAEAKPPYWVLISVLSSTFPLTSPVAMALHEVAWGLYQRDEGAGPVGGDLLSGRVVNLKKDVVLGTIAGPAFEAEVDTERGAGKVRFMLTRQGIELMRLRDEQGEPPTPARPKYLH